MNELSIITDQIKDQALADARRLEAQAHTDCRRMRAEAEQAARDRYWKLVQQGARRCEEQTKHRASAAAMEVHKRLLSKKQELVSIAFQKARDALYGMPRTQYAAFLTALMVKASETGRERVILNPRDRAQLGEACVLEANRILWEKGLPGALVLSDELGQMDGGVILDGGYVRISASLEILLDRCRRDLSVQVAEILFE